MRRNVIVLIFMWALFIALTEKTKDGICPPNKGEYHETPKLYNSIRRYCAHYSSPEDWYKRKTNKPTYRVRQRITATERFNRGRTK